MVTLDEFYARVDGRVLAAGKCWKWKGYHNPDGYAMWYVRRNKRLWQQLAHRISYILVHGDIPAGLEIDHLCRNRWCVNPNHLEAVTQKENNARSNSPSAQHARQTHCVNGHELNKENLYSEKGRRRCKMCSKKHSKNYYWSRVV